MIGSGTSVVPSCSSTSARSTKRAPNPPSDSGTHSPSQPSSAICFHTFGSKPSGSLRSARARDTGDDFLAKLAAVSTRSFWS
jgi:hypothetical protein